jgi:hypothetical protein
MPELRPGDIFAGHRIEGVAGRGGFGVVYRATHLALDHVVALKLISGERAADATFRERFQSESRIAVSIRHPNVVAVHHAGEEDGLLFVTMDFIEGTDLRGLLNREGRLRPERATAIISPVSSALDAAHERGLVHRDIKPGNVLIEERGAEEHVFLTDFGLSKKIDATSGVTASGAFVGTLDYVAPEQIKGERVDARTDVYALGCVLYELLTGEVPFGGEIEKVAKMYAHLQEAPPSLNEKAPDVPGALGDVVWRAMEKDPELRFPSAGDLARAARAASEGRQPSEPERSVGVGAAAPTQAFDALAAAGAGAGAGVETAEAATPETAEATPPETTEAPAGEGALKAGSGGYRGDSEGYPDSTPSPHPAEQPTADATRRRAKARGGPPRGLIIGAVTAAAIAVGAFVLLSGGDGGGGDGGPGDGGSGPSTATAEVVGEPIPVGGFPVGIDVGTKFIWTANRGDGSVTRIDPAKDNETTPVSLGGGAAEGLALDYGRAWVTTNDPDQLVPVQPEQAALAGGTLSLEGGPSDVATGAGSVWVTLLDSDAVAKIGGAGQGQPALADPIPVGGGPYGIAFGAGAVWVSNRDEGTVMRIDPSDDSVGDPIPVGANPKGLAIYEDAVWVANTDDDTITPIDVETLEPGDPIKIGSEPRDVTGGFGSIWVTLGGEDAVARIDPNRRELVDRIQLPAGAAPENLDAGEDLETGKKFVWVANGGTDSVTTIDPSK